VYVFENTNTQGNAEFRLTQELLSYDRFPNEYFGQSVAISSDTSKIVIGANNTRFNPPIRFDGNSTIFDESLTQFYDDYGFSGAVYVFDLKDQDYFLSEKIQPDTLQFFESFGSSVDVSTNRVLVGSPAFSRNSGKGTVRLFAKQSGTDSLNIIGQQTDKVNLNLVKAIELYDNVNDIKIQDIDIIDPAKGKIRNEAEQEIDFKVPYDPAVYTQGTANQVIDEQIAWAEKNVGKVWWDTSTAKWIEYEQGDYNYRLGNWNRQATGSSIDIYEWVESRFLPSEWSVLADTTEGLAIGLSGQPLFADDSVYTEKVILNLQTGQPTETKYYYWVRNTTILPDVSFRRISAATVASIINQPEAIGDAFIGLSGPDNFVLYNFQDNISEDTALLNFELKNQDIKLNPVHSEWQLLSEGLATSVPNAKIENKLIDSLVGYDKAGLKVPDESLPAKRKYGILNRPRQSMFVDRFAALKMAVERVNRVLSREAFADIISFTNLNLKDEAPIAELNLYDLSVETFEELSLVGTVRIRQAVLSINLVDGRVDTVDVVDSGFGYKNVPPVTIEGDGENAEIELTLDRQGRVDSATVTRRGSNYSFANAIVRRFSVLVESDSSASGFWGIYSWDDDRKIFFRSLSQAFDTTRYWRFVDYWKEDFGPGSRIAREIENAYEEPNIDIAVNDLLRIKEYGSGGWAVFRKIADNNENLLDNYELVGRKHGTIQINQNAYDTSLIGTGYDQSIAFDGDFYDITNDKELRNIVTAIKEDIFVGDYAVEWNLLFFACMRYVLLEQTYVDWLVKTSFLKAVHKVGDLDQRRNYKSDNLASYEDYVNEVKPYKTNIREFVSKYSADENSQTGVTDFDLPPYYDEVLQKIVSPTGNDEILDQYPWKWWLDNKGFSVTAINVTDSGAGYSRQPRVIIDGDGTGAEAIAYIANGKVRSIGIINEGFGYTKAPIIKLVGGTDDSQTTAKAVAIIGKSRARTFNVDLKFDRLNSTGQYNKTEHEQQFVASGSSSVFELNYPPTNSKDKIKVLKNDRLVLNSAYTTTLYQQKVNGFSHLKGRIVFTEAPEQGEIIKVQYDINSSIFDAVNRINNFYSPTSGMKGNDLDQLMTGVDYGGVKIQGTTFDVTGGWDALPWFTDSWDSVEASADYYVVVDGSTTTLTLPYIPADGQEINIYVKRAGERVPPSIDDLQLSEEVEEPRTIRIDDPNFVLNGDSSAVTNPNAVMPTFYGDGSTSSIEIGEFIELSAGDTVIFRPAESDGSVSINDPNVLDTRINGGTLSTIDSAYATATGTTAEEISIDGDAFNTPINTPAPEENVPGQVLDSMSFTVYQSSVSGSAPALTKIIKTNGTATVFDIGQRIIENSSVKVFVDKEEKTLQTDFNINLNTNTVEFIDAPLADSYIEIFSIGIGGLRLLDYKEFSGDGETSLFLTSAPYNLTESVFVFLNGEQVEVTFLDSTDFAEQSGRTMIQFGTKPVLTDSIKIIVLGAFSSITSSESGLIRVNEESFEYDSSRRFEITDYVPEDTGSQQSSVIVELNDTVLQGVDTVVVTYDGSNNEVLIAQDPLESPGAVLTGNITVFINNVQKEFITDYVYDGTRNLVILEENNLVVGDVIKVENNFRAEYSIQNGELVIDPSVPLTVGDEIKLTWFAEYPSMEITSDEYVGGKARYNLKTVPVSISFIKVYLNGTRLTQDIDYYISNDQTAIYLKQETTSDDLIKIIAFGADQFKLPAAFEIHKDMLNIDRFFRYVQNNVTLSNDLNYYDNTIVVNNASGLDEPNPARNIPGIVEIGKEKIEYFKKEGNVLSQLRRGALGSAIGEIYSAGTPVINQGQSNVIPYAESQERTDFVSDGSSFLIGPLPIIPAKTNLNNWHRDTIPEEYAQCDDIEIFVGGRRLVKTPRAVFDETIASYSPLGDTTVEAEFAVNGVDNFVRLTSPAPAGTRITVIQKQGSVWYDRGNSTASSGIQLIDNRSAIAKFIQEKSSELPE